jgi:hypothetical protein
MGLKWSWAWGPETALVLETSAGWDFSSTSASNAAPSASGGADPEFTYAGSPTRYTMNLRQGSKARSPLTVGAGAGWLASHFFCNSASGFAGYQFFTVFGSASNKKIYCLGTAPDTIRFYIDNTYVGQTGSIPLQAWNHIAIKFNLLTAQWPAELWINGTLALSGTDGAAAAETASYFQITGLRNAGLADGGFWTGLVHFDLPGDPGSTSRYVTRVSPTSDVSESGSWTPASTPGGTAQTTELASPLNTATTVTEPTPATAENVVLDVNNLGTQLGVTPNIYGVTTHAYAAGTGISIEAAVGEGATYTTGDSIAAGTATYVTATAPTKPAGGAWSSGDTVLLKLQVS